MTQIHTATISAGLDAWDKRTTRKKYCTDHSVDLSGDYRPYLCGQGELRHGVKTEQCKVGDPPADDNFMSFKDFLDIVYNKGKNVGMAH